MSLMSHSFVVFHAKPLYPTIQITIDEPPRRTRTIILAKSGIEIAKNRKFSRLRRAHSQPQITDPCCFTRGVGPDPPCPPPEAILLDCVPYYLPLSAEPDTPLSVLGYETLRALPLRRSFCPRDHHG